MRAESGSIPDIPFARTMGIEIRSARPEQVLGRLPWSPERCTSTGVTHGGALMALGDTLGAICAFLNLPPEATTATVESHTNFLHAVREGAVEGSSRPLHVGNRFIVTQTDLIDSAGRLAAQVTQTQAVIQPAPAADPRP
jgi:1,4-dihydroxy-2-naphthoyl-CoA hydrolase